MGSYIPLLIATVLLACNTGVDGAGVEREGERNEAGVEPVVVRERGAPRIAEMPDIRLNGVLGEKLAWSDQDLEVKLRLTIDQSGTVVAMGFPSVSPPDNDASLEFARFVAEQFIDARFETPMEVSYPCSFEITVKLPAARDASGKWK